MKSEVRDQNNIETITGTVERTTFHNPENGFSVLKVKIKKFKDNIILIGYCAKLSPGENVSAIGEWIHDRTYGQQFKADKISVSSPTSVEGIQKFLSSGFIKGIGPIYAAKLIKIFGDKVLDVIEHQPEQLKKIGGIGHARADLIIKGWNEQRAIKDIMLFLHEHNISISRAYRIHKFYGS